MIQKRKNQQRSTRTILRLPDLDHSKSSVLQSLGSAASKRTYGAAIEDFITCYCSEPRLAFGRTVVLRYRYELEARRLAPATINLRLAAVRRLAYEASDNGLLNPDLAAGIRRKHSRPISICTRISDCVMSTTVLSNKAPKPEVLLTTSHANRDLEHRPRFE